MNLPFEMLVNLFSYLSGSDRAAASRTCRRWYEAANDVSFLSKKSVVITNVERLNTSALKIFEESHSKYSNFLFEDVQLSNEMSEFFNKIGGNIKDLTFDNCKISEKVDLHVLNECSNLQILKIERCTKSLMSELLTYYSVEDATSLNNLKTLSLVDQTFLSDAIFIRFVKAAPNLQELDLTGCTISFNVESNRSHASESTMLTFHSIFEFLVERAQNLKRLSFEKTGIDDAALKCLSEVENLNLDILEVHYSDNITNAGILALTAYQKSLRVLDIGGCTRVTDQSLIRICHNLTNLEELKIDYTGVTDLGIVELINLKKLRVLNISNCEFVTSNGITNGICLNVNRTLNDLDISCLHLEEHCIVNMSEKLPELRKLNVSCCYIAVTDASIQAIFKNQKWLRSLNLSDCVKVSDAGLTGMGECDMVNQGKENKLHPGKSNDYSSPKINLGSEAENEIIRDDQNNGAVMQMSENISDNTISLARLKGLIDLDLSGCFRISDVSLKHAVNLKELVSLDLTYCDKITHESMKFMVKNCPSIETLKLEFRNKINDEGVATIAKGLRRLKELYLYGCDELTDESLESIRSHCECLRFLDVSGSRKLSKEVALSLKTHIKTLRTVFGL